MRARLLALACATLALAAVAPSRAETAYGPPYQPGPKGGDQFNLTSADPATGRVTVLRAYPIPGTFSCGGAGGFAFLAISPTAAGTESEVTVTFTEAALDSFTWAKAVVRDAAGRWIGSASLKGPVAGDGTLAVPLEGGAPVAGSALQIQFGVEVASACPNVDGGTARFTSIAVS